MPELLRVVIESPFAGAEIKNRTYAQACLLDSLKRGEAPLAGHLLYTQALNDRDPEDRALGMAAGFRWYGAARLLAVYTDLGISPGMIEGMNYAKREYPRLPVEFRSLPEWKAYEDQKQQRGLHNGYAAAEMRLRRQLEKRELDPFELPPNPYKHGLLPYPGKA